MSDTPVTLLSANPQDAKLEALKSLFPEAFSEGKLNTTILVKTLGEESVSSEKEAYGMTWAGKSDARKQILTPTKKTLIPDTEASVDYENTNNILIEGDNLEVLKLLQKGYSKEVKMIYIDPPYNTGKDFVYRDNFTSDKTEYEESTGQRDSDGNRLIQNTETNGRYHSDWLSMMYPRLHLARNLLRDDGVIFVSIDDHEVHNLRKIMDEIFGEENFVSEIIWQKKTGSSDALGIAIITEYVLVYVKKQEFIGNVFSRNLESYDIDRYSLSDEYLSERGNYYIDNLDRGGLQYSDSLNFGITCPDGTITFPNGRNMLTQEGWIWKWSKKKVEWAIDKGFIEFRKSKTKESGWAVCYKNYLNVDNEGNSIIRSAPHKNLINTILNAHASGDMKNIFNETIFQYSKPVEFIKKIISFTKLDQNDLILDFFAGSGTTGHAVMALNAEEKTEAVKNGTNPDEVGNRRYICVQLPEPTDAKSEAYKAGYKKISEITAERLRRAGAKIREEYGEILKQVQDDKKSLDTGFQLYRLDESCYQVASVDYRSEDAQGTLDSFEKAIQSGLSPLRDGVREADVMVEVLLKEGFPLTSVWTEVRIGENTFLHTEYAGKQLYMSFESLIAVSTIQTLSKEHSEAIFVVYDTALDDSRKVMLSARVKLRTI